MKRRMLRVLAFAALLVAVPHALAGQQPGMLRVKIVLVDAVGIATPVPQHVLFVSDNPPSAPPRRMITAPDGTGSLSLRPGNYTVESAQPVAFENRAYRWMQTVDVAAGREAVLELTAQNAEAGPVTAATDAFSPSSAAAPLGAAPSALLVKWQDSVVALWTPTTHASGFVIDARGLIATSQRSIGAATSIEVQLTPAMKVAGRVLVNDPVRDVAILQIDPAVLSSVMPVPLGCALPARPPLAGGQDLVAIGAPLGEPKRISMGAVTRAVAQMVESDLVLSSGSAGGPVFGDDGNIVGITSVLEDDDERRRGDVRVVRIDGVCELVAPAEKAMTTGARPTGSRLPIEPATPFPADALRNAPLRLAEDLRSYQASSSGFEITFITPLLAAGAAPRSGRALTEFSNWSEYVEPHPPVLFVRATPKQAESFWTTVARGAAMTQGVALPPIKRFRSGFLRMRAYCGETEVTPIHPFALVTRVSESDAIHEGLYVFDPGALGPQCGTVKLVLYSEKEPGKGDARVIDPKVIQQIWLDFAPYRALK